MTPIRRLLLGGSMLCLLAAPAWAGDPVTHNVQPQAATLSHWTAEAMANAKPRALPVVTQADHRAKSSMAPTGTPGAAGGTANIPLPSTAQDELQNGAPIPADGAYPGPNTTFTLDPAFGAAKPQYTAYPYSTIGRLFFTEPGVGDFVCSAATTYGGAALNIVWTAGHCVAGGGQKKFFTNWLFCPAWAKQKGGPNPTFGCWTWSFATTTNAWFNQGAFTRDYAAIGMSHTGTVQPHDVVSVVGGQGFAWNWGRDQNWVHMGYPAAAPYDGGFMVVTNTEHRYDDVPDTFGPPTNSWGTAQTPGSSGSPVLLFWSLGGGFINSNVSYYYSGGPHGNEYGHEIQGPYYDTTVCTFWKSVTGWPGTC